MQHLSDDAEFAEDLAIRYADRPRPASERFESVAEYKQARNTCMASLFRVIGSIHKVPEEQVRRSLGHRRIPFDVAVFLSFAVLYAWGTSLLARWLCRIYGPREGLLTIAIMTVLVALLASVAGVMLGEMWSWTWETHRFGNHHMSYRAARIPWTYHRLELFIIGTTIFLLIAGFHRRRAIATSFRTSKETHNLQG